MVRVSHHTARGDGGGNGRARRGNPLAVLSRVTSHDELPGIGAPASRALAHQGLSLRDDS
jgi:hypothetical protein